MAQNETELTSSPLDPADWEAFRNEAHRLLDACIDQLSDARNRPWRPLSAEHKEALRLGDVEPGVDGAALIEQLAHNVLPFHTGNTHPRFFGWVHGTGLANGLLAEMVAATMNSK